ncbi:DUF309 domain-containing protein [Pontibacillus litoralis]|uniref:DUF309 domain-containing protein n=1 Tax=Pontibacillus litoralis JSM 072002 TaxID=1385512 RepID=A0A0A5HQS7_9BACI|nr:DUF309 domain-containing protein [Pontibacillus litoralis]KGX85967.1 hypothetical protein N784_06235 [Pontibacillus litoralis JSM 072002]
MYDQAYIDFLAHFHGTRDYFECHEILEEKWKQSIPLDRQSILVGFIQLAVSMYHYRRCNKEGAKRTAHKAHNILRKHKAELPLYGFNKQQMLSFIRTLIDHIENDAPYESVNLPIKDQRLLDIVHARCSQLHCTYGDASPMNNPAIIDRHMWRDRSDVIAERKRQLQIRLAQRGY